MSRNSRARRKCHAARRRANRLRREAAKADLARGAGGTAVPDVADPGDAYEVGRAANASCSVGCAMAVLAAVALLAWYAWCR